MHAPSRGGLRLIRASAWAVAAMGLSSGAHLVGGGALPSPGAAALITAALLWTGLVLTRWRLGRIALTLSLGLSQVLLHAVLTALESSAAGCVVTGSHHATMVCTGGASPMPHDTSPTMALAHTAAAFLLGLLLARGEATVWFLAGLLRPHLPRPAALPTITHRPLGLGRVGELVRSVVVPGGVGRRGPPVPRAPTAA